MERGNLGPDRILDEMAASAASHVGGVAAASWVPTLWGSRLKMLRNKCYPSFSLLNSISTTICPTYFPDYVRDPDEIPSIRSFYL